MRRLFEFRDPTPIEGFVLAEDYEHAVELFQLYLLTLGGDPDTLLWREWTLDDLEGAPRSAVNAALEIDRDGLATGNAYGRWVFITPLGNHAEVLDEP